MPRREKRKVGRPRKEDTEVIYIRIPRTLARALRQLAEEERREMSAMVRVILEKALFPQGDVEEQISQ